MSRLAFALAAVLAGAGCDQPPVKEIAAAEQQVERARAAGAERYAPERWKQAETALVLARQRLEGRDYRSALSAASDAAENARLAMEATGPAKEAATRAIQVAIGEVRTALDRADQERRAALKAGVAARALAALDKRSAEARQQLEAAGRALEAGELEYADQMMAELRTQVTPLPDLYRGARTQLAAKQPRRGRGASPRRR